MTNKKENESEMKRGAREREAEAGKGQRSEGDGLRFNSINSSKPDSHVIIKNHPIYH